MQAQKEIANQSLIEIDDLSKHKSGFGIIFRGNDKCLNPWALMNRCKLLITKPQIIYIYKVKPSVEIKFRVLVTFEKVSYAEKGNEFYDTKPNCFYNRNAQLVVKYMIKISSGRPDKINDEQTKTLEVFDEEGKPIGSGWK